MAASVSNRSHALPRKSLADVCLQPAKASLALESSDPIYDCIDAVRLTFALSEKEMAAKLDVAQSNYSRRTYNAARVQRLPDDMRRLFIQYFAKAEGLHVDEATPHEQVKNAAKLAIVNLLELLESA